MYLALLFFLYCGSGSNWDMYPEQSFFSGKSKLPIPFMLSLGILFHEYWTGKRPEFDRKYHLACEAVCDDSPIILSTALPKDISMLISDMLSKKPEDRISAWKALNILAGTTTSNTAKTETSAKVSRGFYRADEFD